jgi:hypothetical protein
LIGLYYPASQKVSLQHDGEDFNPSWQETAKNLELNALEDIDYDVSSDGNITSVKS